MYFVIEVLRNLVLDFFGVRNEKYILMGFRVLFKGFFGSRVILGFIKNIMVEWNFCIIWFWVIFNFVFFIKFIKKGIRMKIKIFVYLKKFKEENKIFWKEIIMYLFRLNIDYWYLLNWSFIKKCYKLLCVFYCCGLI